MFEKFGELNSFGEINELAENLFNEGDTESLRAMAKENGIQSDFVDMYLQGEIPALCDQLTAALGKIDVEVAELKPKPYTPDSVYASLILDQQDTSNNNQVGDKMYQSRHQCCVKWIKQYVGEEKESAGMTENELRQMVANNMRGWIGLKRSHRKRHKNRNRL